MEQINTAIQLHAKRLEKRIPRADRISFYNYLFDYLEATGGFGWEERSTSEALAYINFHYDGGLSGFVLRYYFARPEPAIESYRLEA